MTVSLKPYAEDSSTAHKSDTEILMSPWMAQLACFRAFESMSLAHVRSNLRQSEPTLAPYWSILGQGWTKPKLSTPQPPFTCHYANFPSYTWLLLQKRLNSTVLDRQKGSWPPCWSMLRYVAQVSPVLITSLHLLHLCSISVYFGQMFLQGRTFVGVFCTMQPFLSNRQVRQTSHAQVQLLNSDNRWCAAAMHGCCPEFLLCP